MERNYLANGRFLHNLDGWTASGAAYSAGDGDAHYGVAVLSTGGDCIEQDFAVPRARGYTLHVAVKAVGADLSGSQAVLSISDSEGNELPAQNLSGTADTWVENTVTLGLAPGTTYTLRITNVSATGDVRIDDVWAWWVPMTRDAMASQVHAKLARLATERSLSTAEVGALTEGDYTYAVDAGLRQIGALNPETDLPDVRYLEATLLDAVLDAIEREMLERLRRDYAVEVDISAGPHQESLSQIGKALAEMTDGVGSKSSGGRVISRSLYYRADDYEFG